MKQLGYGILTTLLLAGCQSESTQSSTSSSPSERMDVTVTFAPENLDRRCDDAAVYSRAWMACEQEAVSLLRLGTEETLTNPTLLAETLRQGGIHFSDYLQLLLNDPTRLVSALSPSTLATVVAMGDPFRHPSSTGPNGAQFYENEAIVERVFFYDRTCARLDGRVWAPKAVGNQRLPAVVINNGSVAGTQPMYFWAAQALVRAGYVVMTYDVRSQGLSDAISPTGTVGSNIEPSVFWLNLVDAIDFLQSSPDQPHPQQAVCGGGSNTTAFNPLHKHVDTQRIGVAGHSFGAAGASFAQSYGAPGADPWPGSIQTENPIKAIVAWDALGHSASPINANGGPLVRNLGNLGGPLYTLSGQKYPAIVPRVPALDLPSDFGVFSTPHLAGEEPQRFMGAFNSWVDSGVDAMVVVPFASTHTQYSQNPFLPSSSWCGDPSKSSCETGWVIPMATHYTVAWFDRWLKLPGEPGHATADDRLLDNGNPLTGAVNMSWHYQSARHLHDRNGDLHRCNNLRKDC